MHFSRRTFNLVLVSTVFAWVQTAWRACTALYAYGTGSAGAADPSACWQLSPDSPAEATLSQDPASASHDVWRIPTEHANSMHFNQRSREGRRMRLQLGGSWRGWAHCELRWAPELYPISQIPAAPILRLPLRAGRQQGRSLSVCQQQAASCSTFQKELVACLPTGCPIPCAVWSQAGTTPAPHRARGIRAHSGAHCAASPKTASQDTGEASWHIHCSPPRHLLTRLKSPPPASQNTLKHFSILYMTSPLRTLQQTAFDAFWLTASGFTGSQTCALQNTLQSKLQIQYKYIEFPLQFMVSYANGKKLKQNQSYTLP